MCACFWADESEVLEDVRDGWVCRSKTDELDQGDEPEEAVGSDDGLGGEGFTGLPGKVSSSSRS